MMGQAINMDVHLTFICYTRRVLIQQDLKSR